MVDLHDKGVPLSQCVVMVTSELLKVFTDGFTPADGTMKRRSALVTVVINFVPAYRVVASSAEDVIHEQFGIKRVLHSLAFQIEFLKSGARLRSQNLRCQEK